jgi:hypothetical protein
MHDPRAHTYMKKLLRLYAEGKLPTRDLWLLDIYHDDWCGIYRGRRCNCDPDIRLRQNLSWDPRRN